MLSSKYYKGSHPTDDELEKMTNVSKCQKQETEKFDGMKWFQIFLISNVIFSIPITFTPLFLELLTNVSDKIEHDKVTEYDDPMWHSIYWD